MKIVFLEADTLGTDIDLSGFEELGEVVRYGKSNPEENAKRIEDADIIIVMDKGKIIIKGSKNTTFNK